MAPIASFGSIVGETPEIKLILAGNTSENSIKHLEQ